MELTWSPEILPNVASLTPYPPGKPIEETERELGITGIVKMASNENPLGPSPRAMEAIRAAVSNLHVYPDGSHYGLKRAVAKFSNCAAEEIMIGNGSNELLDLLPRAFIPRNRNMVTHKAAFAIYRLVAQLRGCGCIEAPIDEKSLTVTVDSVLSSVNADTRMVFLANPNNPTGGALSVDEIDTLAKELDKRHILLVLDYAYWEFVTDKHVPDPMVVWRKFSNVIILRTFSKVYGLAGARVGYMIANRNLVSTVEKCRQPFNISSAALVGAAAALEDQDHVHRSVNLTIESKAELAKGLALYPVHVYPSQGNFYLVDMHRPSAELYPEFLKRGVIIRPVLNYGLPTCFRVSAGLPKENEKFFAAMDGVFGKPSGSKR